MKSVGMIVDIRSLAAQGLKKTQIARRLGIHRDTVAKYLESQIPPEEIKRKEVACKTDPYRDYVKARLEQWPELSAERLCREMTGLGYTGSSRSVRRLVAKMKAEVGKPRVYKPVETLPGEQAQVDWGHFGTITKDGQELKLYAFVLVMSYSRVRYVEYTTSQDMATFLACHKRALEYLGGCPHVIVYDNAKTVVSDRVGSVVCYQADLLRFAASYGFKPRACWAYDPESKGKVENAVKYVRRDFFYATEFSSLDDLNRQARDWYRTVANAKVCEATNEVPLERLEQERPLLIPLPPASFGAGIEIEAKVTKTCLISWGGNQYSVPHHLARRKVTLRVYEDHLDVIHDGEKVVSLVRAKGKGQRIIDNAHYAGRSAGSGKGSPLQRRFEQIGPAAAEYLRGIAKSPRGTTLRDQATKILALCESHGTEAVHQAMERATTFGAYGYGFLKRIVLKQAKVPESLPDHPTEGAPVTTGLPDVKVEQRSLDYYAKAGRD
jgi:transposase